MRSILLDLTRRYLEPHRAYHALPHIADMLQRGRDLQLTDVQIAAIWFHDAVYDSQRKDNEAQSAALAVTSLTAEGWAPRDVQLVERIVLDTEKHVPSVPEAEVVIDLDLASLALPWEGFTANTAAVRAEFLHVPEADFRAGRAAFFARMLERKQLFWTPYGRALEAQARANLARGLRELG